MTRAEAFRVALQRFGQNAIVGVNYNYRQKFHVGVQGQYGRWEKRGTGHSWEEAFANVEEFPDGKLFRTHGSKRAPDA